MHSQPLEPASGGVPAAVTHDGLIRLNWSIARVLEHYPPLLDVLVGLFPGFARLRNPILRRLRAPRVTVAQAARVAGMPEADLLGCLNAAAGLSPSEPPSPVPVPPVPASLAPPHHKSALPEPVSPVSTSPALDAHRGPAPSTASADALPGMIETLTINVSDLVPPEPMLRILETLERLSPGGTLVVHHVRRPVYLYPRLDALGYAHQTDERGPNDIEIRICKPPPADGNEADRAP